MLRPQPIECQETQLSCSCVRVCACETVLHHGQPQGHNQLEFSRGGDCNLLFYLSTEKVIGTFKMFLHSYLIVNAAHTTYCYWQGCGVGGKSSDSGFPKFPSPTPQHKRNEIWMLKSMEILVHSSKRSLFQ